MSGGGAAGPAMLVLVVIVLVLAVLAIFMPYFVYRMKVHLQEIDKKMGEVIRLLSNK